MLMFSLLKHSSILQEKEKELNEEESREAANPGTEVGEDIEEIEVVAEVKRKLGDKEAVRLVPREVKNEPESGNSCGYRGCRKSFTTAATMVCHLESHYREGSSMKCPFGGCSFSGIKMPLVRHIRSKHTKEKLFYCQVGCIYEGVIS